MTELLFSSKKSSSRIMMICFPYLGGFGIAYSDVVRHVKSDVEILTINPPGHGTDSQPLLESIEDMAQLYWKILSGHLKEKWILLGHSLGAYVILQMCYRFFPDSAAVKPDALILSGANAPHRMMNHQKYLLPDEELIRYISHIGAIPDEILREKDILNYFLPSLRADMKSAETMKIEPKKDVSIPVHYGYAADDPFVTVESALEWKRYFKNISFSEFTGGHMYFKKDPKQFAAFLDSVISRI